MKPIRLTAAFCHAIEGGYTAYVEEIPGIHAQGETIEETRRHIEDGVDLWFRSNPQLTREAYGDRPVVKRETFAVVRPVEPEPKK